MIHRLIILICCLFARRLRCILKIMTVIQKTLFLAAGQPKKCLVWKGHNTKFSQYSCFLYIFSRILGAYIWTIRESVRFASERSRVRVSSGPPLSSWTAQVHDGFFIDSCTFAAIWHDQKDAGIKFLRLFYPFWWVVLQCPARLGIVWSSKR